MLQNDLFLRALLRQPTERTPVWMMRQAGRYLPEYRATRERAGSFLKLCMTPELACEVTLQPLARYPLDAAILFSDILTIPHALGLGLQFETGEGPKIDRPVRSPARRRRLGRSGSGCELRYVMDAVALIRRELQRQSTADRIRRQPVDGRHLHRRRRQLARVLEYQGDDVRHACGTA